MSIAKKYYYQGYECLATFNEKSGQWLCVVENVTYPFSFEASEERFIQGNFEHDLHDYIEKCRARGISPKKESVLHNAHHDRHFVIARSMRSQDKERIKKEKRKQREFDRSYWRYLVPLTLAGIPAMGYLMLATLGRSILFSMFFPYRANVQTKRRPVLTMAVCAICILVYIGQCISDWRFERDCNNFAQQPQFAEFFSVMHTSESMKPVEACYYFDYLRGLKNPEMLIIKQATDILEDKPVELRRYTVEELSQVLQNAYDYQVKNIRPTLTSRLEFHTNQFDVLGAYTNEFAHGSWDHILFNLIFFFAFAASVEVLAGPAFFISLFAVIPVFVAVFYSDSFVVAGDIHGNASLGLSDLCTAFMACLLVLKPKLEIKTFFWFVFIVRSYSVPIWFLAAWYVSSDLTAMLANVDDNIGHIAHFVGACTGALAGLIFRLSQKPMDHQSLVEHTAT